MITDYFRRTKTLVNYFYTLESCLRCLNPRSPSKLLSEIDEAYPRLNAAMQCALLSGGRALPFEWRLFARSPECWWTWIRARRHIDGSCPTDSNQRDRWPRCDALRSWRDESVHSLPFSTPKPRAIHRCQRPDFV